MKGHKLLFFFVAVAARASLLTEHFPAACDNLLSPIFASKGLGNYILEFKKYAALARVTGRRLCLEPFHEGKTSQDTSKWHAEGISNYFDLGRLGEYIPLVSPEVCSKCKVHHPFQTVVLRDYAAMSIATVEEMFAREELRNVTRAVQLVLQYGELELPFLIRSELQTTVPLYLLPSKEVSIATQTILNSFSHPVHNTPFYNLTCFHWRFEEKVCQNEKLGLCQRVVPPPSMMEKKHKGSPHFIFSEDDVSLALSSVQAAERSENVLVISDGHLRGRSSQALVGRIKDRLGLLELKDISSVSSALDYLFVSGFSHEEDVLPVLERELCKYAAVVIGTLKSSFSLDILQSQAEICDRVKSLNSSGGAGSAACTPVSMNDNLLAIEGGVGVNSFGYPHQYHLQHLEENLYLRRGPSEKRRYYEGIVFGKRKKAKGRRKNLWRERG